MPKRKGNPVKLSVLQRREESYCFGGTHNNVPVAAEEPNVQPSKSPKAKASASPKKRNSIEPTNAKNFTDTERGKYISIVGEEIEDLIKDQNWSVLIQRQLDTSPLYYLGDVTFKIHDHAIGCGEDLPPEPSTIKLFISNIPSRSMLYFEMPEEICETNRGKFFTIDGPSLHTLKIEMARPLTFGMKSYDTETREFCMSAYMLKSDVKEKHCEDLRKDVKDLQPAMEFFYDIKRPFVTDYFGASFSIDNEIEDLYTAVKSHHAGQNYSPDIDVQHPCLQVQLRPYQTAAVKWMLHREAQLNIPCTELHPLYISITTKCGTVLYFNSYFGFLVHERPIKSSVTGGILADEMGLGKTVEVLSCMLANPRKDLPIEEEETVKQMEESTPEIGEEMNDSVENVSASENSGNPVVDVEMADVSIKDEPITIVEENLREDEDGEVATVSDQENFETSNPGTSGNVKEEAVASSSTSNVNGNADEAMNAEADSNTRRSQRRCVRFAEPSVITYDDYADSDSSDVSWHEGLRFGDHVKPKKKAKKTVTKKPVKRLKPTRKSILKNKDEPSSVIKELEKTDPIAATIESVIEKYGGKPKVQSPESLARKAVCAARRKAARDAYELALSQMSGTRVLYDKERQQRYAGFFEKVTSKSLFECVCGAEHVGHVKEQIKCSQCEVRQHAECMKYDKNTHKQYFCPHCWQLQPVVPSRATLIVAPSSISQQWMDEISKLIKHRGIKADFYSGVQSNGFVQPRGLADHDIVITTYETLCKELDYVNLPHNNSSEGRRFRNAKRYMALPSPLPCVQWWRVCLDEAQMVECTTTKTAEMALKLQAVHRWCVTGTPLQRSISDLYGLILFLNVDPYSDKQLWGGQVVCPYREGQRDTLHKVVCPLMWRTAKADVLDQIGIPGQTEEMHWIHFSPAEEYFYRSQHVHCANVVLHRIALFDDLDTKLHSLSKDTLNSIVSPLLGLRQACCHPQAVKGQFISLNKSTMTMEELLKSLIKKARVECEESFRQVVSSLNGLAGIHVIQEDWLTAVERYREILMLIEQNKDKVKADRLQRIHTLHNLAELLEIHSDNLNIPRTTRDATLRQEAAELETTYLDKCIASLTSAKQAVDPLIQAVSDLQQQLTLNEAWWSLTLGQASVNKEEHEVVERVRQALMGGRRKYKNTSYNSLTGLESVLTQDTDALETQRVKLLNDMEKLESMDPQTLVNEAVECHLRTIPNPEGKKVKTKKVCKLCKTSELFESYEKLLFREEEAQIDTAVVENVRVFGKLNRNVWAEGEIQKILKAVLGYAKLKKLDETWIADGNVQLKIMDSEKKEFKHLRIFWRQLNDRVSALDELNMCKLRLRIRFPHEPSMKTKQNKKKAGKQPLENLSSNLENKVENIYIIEEHEVESYALRLTTERSTAQSNLRRRMGQLQYLENLERDGLSKKGGANTELCPICRRTLEEKWSVLLCGHCYCMECLRQLGKHQHIRRQVCCPVCRECTALAEISYVNMNLAADVPKAALAFPEPPQPSEDQSMVPDAPQVRGRNSAKAEAVVQVLKNILAEDSNAKVLVFSTWASMLIVLARALRDNDISCVQLESGAKNKFQVALNLFKDPTKNVTALLLPVHSGANGLNLIEATHVLLVEPILNPASELQALGRVHRIGQTRPTVIHRFVVRGTIEERMHEVLKAHHYCNTLEKDPVSLRDLYDMFSSTPSGSQEG